MFEFLFSNTFSIGCKYARHLILLLLLFATLFQFFITTGSNLDYLDNVHTVFGEVSEGLDVLEKINETIVDDEHRPFQDVR